MYGGSIFTSLSRSPSWILGYGLGWGIQGRRGSKRVITYCLGPQSGHLDSLLVPRFIAHCSGQLSLLPSVGVEMSNNSLIGYEGDGTCD